MKRLFILLCIFLSIKFIDNTQCVYSRDLAGYCGCCSIIGGNCIHYETLDGLDMSWHVCVPPDLVKTFSLKLCKPKLIEAKNSTLVCNTNKGSFRLFPQCTTKKVCSLPTQSRNLIPDCKAPMAVAGSCKTFIKYFTYDAKRHVCVPFMYSGCRGSRNRFTDLEKCVKTCVKKT